MCKVRQLDELLKQRKELDKQIKALQDEYISYMVANGVDKVYSEDNEKYIKLIHCDEKFMSYTKPAYDYVRVFWEDWVEQPNLFLLISLYLRQVKLFTKIIL